MSDPCKVAVQAGGRATTAKQHVLLQAESEDVEAKKQTLPLPPHCPQGLNTLQKGVGASFGQDLARSLSLQWQIVKGFIVYSLGLSIKLLNANFSLSLSFRHIHTGANTPPDVNQNFSNESLYPQFFTHKQLSHHEYLE